VRGFIIGKQKRLRSLGTTIVLSSISKSFKMKNYTPSRKAYKVIITSLLLSVNAFAFAQNNHERESSRNNQRQSNASGQADNRQRASQQRQPVNRTADVQRSPNVQRQADNRQRDFQQRQPVNRTADVQRSPNVQRQADNRQRDFQQRQPVNRTADVQRSADNRQRDFQQRQPVNRTAGVQRSADNRQRDLQQRQQSQVYNYNRSPNSRPSYSNGASVNRFSPVNRTSNGYYSRNYGYNGYRPQYNRQPVIWQGHRYYSNYNYSYHSYQPYYYGSFFHPFGYFVASLSAAAINIALNDQYYRYDQGVYYAPYNNGYQVVPAPQGAYISQLPNGYTVLDLPGGYAFYYYAGTFYADRQPNGYTVITAPPGAIVYDLPEGATEMQVGNITYLKYNNAIFQPVVIDGKNAYEVVDLDANDQ